MDLKPQELERDLERGLQPLYYLAGEEPYLVEESRGAILEAARKRGHEELSRLDIGSQSWQDVLSELNSRSLFADRRIIEVRLGRNGMAGAASGTLEKYLENPAEENVVIVRARTFDSRHRRSTWFKKLNAKAAMVICDRLGEADYYKWVDGKARAVGLDLSKEALDTLATSCEGNLAAAAQELEKLSLISANSEDQVDASTVDVQDFSTGSKFELIDSALSGDIERTVKVLRILEREGESPLNLIGLLHYQLRRAIGVGKRGGFTPHNVRAVLNRHGEMGILELIRQVAAIDGQVKGLYRSDGWSALMHLFLVVAGGASTLPSNLTEHSRIDYEMREED